MSFLRLLISSGKVDVALKLMRQRYTQSTDVYSSKQLAHELGVDIEGLNMDDHAYNIVKELSISPAHVGSIVKSLHSNGYTDAVYALMIIVRDLALASGESALNSLTGRGRGIDHS